MNRHRFTCWVCFCGSSYVPFWRAFTSPGWRHCFIVKPAYWPDRSLNATRSTLVLEPKTYGLECDVAPVEPEEWLANWTLLAWPAPMAIVRVQVDMPPAKLQIMRGLISCVSVVKAALGLRAWPVWTPRGLYRLLIRRGALDVTSSMLAAAADKLDTDRQK